MLNKLLFLLLIATCVVLAIMVKNSYQSTTKQAQQEVITQQNIEFEKTKAEYETRINALTAKVTNLSEQCFAGLRAYEQLSSYQSADLQAPICTEIAEQ